MGGDPLDPAGRLSTSIDKVSDPFTPNSKGFCMLLLIDNYDSFTWNLVHLVGALGVETQVVRNDEVTVAEALALRPEAFILSPGPCDPAQAGICLELTKAAAQARLPLFGVCLGHQTIGEAFGGRVTQAEEIVHGKVARIEHAGQGVFADLPSPLRATRYHSLTVARDGLPPCLEITAWVDDGTIMGLRHKELPIEGVQFHPESIASEHGVKMLQTFLNKVLAPA